MDLAPILGTWRQALTVDFLRYFLPAAPFFLVFWVWGPGWLASRRTQPAAPDALRIASEIAYSLMTVVVFSAIGTALFFAQRAGLTRIYLNLGERGWPYFWASIAAAILLHDTYFYWTHRLLHCLLSTPLPITSITAPPTPPPWPRTPSIPSRPP